MTSNPLRALRPDSQPGLVYARRGWRAQRHTLHSDLLVIIDRDFRQRTLLQASLSVNVELDVFLEHDRRGVLRERVEVLQVELLVDLGNNTISSLDGRDLEHAKGLVRTVECEICVECVEDRRERAVGANDLLDVEVEDVRTGIGNDHLGDGECRGVDVLLRDVGVSDVDAVNWSVTTLLLGI